MTQIVQNLTTLLFSPDFLSQHRKSEKDFTRNRSLTFPRLISLPSEAPEYGDMSQGMWLPNLDDRFAILEKGSTCSSDVGSVEPSKYLPFLIHFRKIVEADKTGDEKLKLFLKMKDLPEFSDFWLKHNERGDYFYMKYVYGTLINIPGVSPQMLFDMGFRDSNELNDKPDNFWLDMKGVGKAKLKKIMNHKPIQYPIDIIRSSIKIRQK